METRKIKEQNNFTINVSVYVIDDEIIYDKEDANKQNLQTLLHISNTPSEVLLQCFSLNHPSFNQFQRRFFPTPGLCAQPCADFIHLLGAQPSLWMRRDGTTDHSRKTPFKAWGFAPSQMSSL